MKQFREETIEKLCERTNEVLYQRLPLIHISNNRQFVMITSKANVQFLCSNNIELMADHLSEDCPILKYFYMVHG